MMPSPATEIAIFPVLVGANLEDPNSPTGKVWHSVLDTVSSQEGFQRAYFGREVEDQSMVQLLIDWDSYDHHQTFVKSPIYGPFVKSFQSILDGPINMMHANFTPHPPSAAASNTTSPMTEVLLMYLETKDESIESKFNKLIGVISENAEGYKASAGGWVIEDVEHKSFGEGKKGKVYAGLIGWESKDAHMRFRETQKFKDNIHLLRGPEVKALEVNHTSFTER